MKAGCIPHTQIPSTSRLYLDFVYHYERVADFYPSPPTVEAAQAAAPRVDLSDDRRSALAGALGPLNAAGGERVREHLALLSRPGTVAVVTGQQAGLFGGPAYAYYKALTAVRAAERLRELGTPAVPVFWLATEDHDLAEIDHAWAFGLDGEPQRLEATVFGPANRPVGDLAIERAPLDALESSLTGLPYAGEATTLVREAYRDGATFGEAYAAYFQRLLEPYGVVLIEPMLPGVRKLAGPLIAEAVERLPELIHALTKRGRELDERGYHQQAVVSEKGALLFHLGDRRRTAIQRHGERFRAAGREWSAAELAAAVGREPEAFSPNALLRPVVQDYILPTTAFVGGPSELAYLAQSETLYERLLGRMPTVLPRAGFTLLDARAAKLLERFKLRPADCFTHWEELKARIGRALTPTVVEGALATQRRRIEGALDEMGAALSDFDPTLQEAFERSRKKIGYQLDKTARKADRESLRRDERAERDARYLFHLIHPQRRLQERFYALPSLHARFGPALIPELYEAVALHCLDHQALAP